MAFVYILKSNSKDCYYIGSTRDLSKRLNEHQKGKCQYTKGILPVYLVFQQECLDYSQARALELKLKRYKRKDFIEKIIKEGRIKAV